MASLKVIAIDPGERTGWARATVVDGVIGEPVHGVSALQDFALKLGQVISDYDVVIYETWRLYPHMARKMIGNDMQPSQLVGIIRYLGWTNPGVKLVSQGANIKDYADKTMPEPWQERMAVASEEHDQDALRHLWYWYWRAFVVEDSHGKQAITAQRGDS